MRQNCDLTSKEKSASSLKKNRKNQEIALLCYQTDEFDSADILDEVVDCYIACNEIWIFPTFEKPSFPKLDILIEL